jgi:hypothetical protein
MNAMAAACYGARRVESCKDRRSIIGEILRSPISLARVSFAQMEDYGDGPSPFSSLARRSPSAHYAADWNFVQISPKFRESGGRTVLYPRAAAASGVSPMSAVQP